MPKFLDTMTEDKKELKAKLKKLDYEYYKAKPAQKDMIMKKRLATLRLIYGDAVDNTFVNKIKVPQTEKNIKKENAKKVIKMIKEGYKPKFVAERFGFTRQEVVAIMQAEIDKMS